MSNDNNKDDLRSIDLFNTNDLDPQGFIDKRKLNVGLKSLDEVKEIVCEMQDIEDRTNIPLEFSNNIMQWNNIILQIIKNIGEVHNETSDVVARKKDGVLQKISTLRNSTFNFNDPNRNFIIEQYSVMKSMDKKDLSEVYSKKLDALLDSMNQSKEDTIKFSQESENILNELKKKVSTETVSDYAQVFKTESNSYNLTSYIWLGVGIFSTIVFILILSFNGFNQLLPVEILEAETDKLLRYSYSNLATKLIIYALFIFVISFSFKQFSINRHLFTLNKHRQNALNSYKLFTESIVGEDNNSRNALMVQVAKSIYEHAQSTGYLNEKNQTMNSGVLELTKIIGENKTS